MEKTNYNAAKVSIYGKQFNIAGEASRGDILLYAKYVDEKIDSLIGRSQRPLNTNLMILIALNITEDLYRVKAERDDAIELLKDKNQKLEGAEGVSTEGVSFQEYEESCEERIKAEEKYKAALEEIADLKEENRLLYKKINEIREELDKIKKKSIQMQMFIPKENEIKSETQKTEEK